MKRVAAFNDRGRPIGERHHFARLLDHEVLLVLDLVEAGLSYSRIAEKFGVSKSCIAHIAAGRRRCQTPARLVEVSVSVSVSGDD